MQTPTVLSPDSTYRIGIKDASLRPAAAWLCDLLTPALHTALPLTDTRVSPCLFLQTDNALGTGYTIVADGADMVITGADLSETMRGISVFLQTLCGIRMFSADGVTYPAALPPIPGDTNLRGIPPFEYTETDWFSPKHPDYALFHHLTGTRYRRIPKELGGGISFLSSFAHTLTTEFCSADTYFDTHPKYFALRNGRRTKKQLCLSNPAVAALVTDEVLALLKEKHDPEAPLQIVSLSQADNLSFCRCPACRALDKQHGSHAGSLLTFVNRVAQAVKAAGYDNVALETFAYQYTRKPPKDLRPAPNVLVRLCAIECCFSHPLSDPHCKSNAAFAADLREWATLCDRLYVWDYTTNYSHFAGPFPNFRVLAPNMRFYAENGVKGIYSEGNYTLKAPDTEFGELRAYLLSRLFADPTCDIEKEREAFLTATYGAGGKSIGAFLDLIGENAARRHLGIFQPMRKTLSLTREEIRRCDALWEQALTATGRAGQNARRAHLCWRYWKMKNRKSEFRNPVSYRRHRAALFCDLQQAGMTLLQESAPARSFWNSLFQWLFFAAYTPVSRVMRWLYRV